MSKLTYGVGINDADYVVQPTVDGDRVYCLYYVAWRGMLRRCYCEACLKRQPTYQDCSVCPAWLLFSNFRAWMEKQDWQGKALDKDLLGGGKLYSPATCCFVEQWLNNLFVDHGRARGEWPIGVYYHKSRRKFSGHLRVNGALKRLGYFDTPEDAHAAYLKAKREYVQDKMKNYPNAKIKRAVLAKVA